MNSLIVFMISAGVKNTVFEVSFALRFPFHHVFHMETITDFVV